MLRRPIWLHLENGRTLAQAVCPLQRMKQEEKNFKDLPKFTQILEPNSNIQPHGLNYKVTGAPHVQWIWYSEHVCKKNFSGSL